MRKEAEDKILQLQGLLKEKERIEVQIEALLLEKDRPKFNIYQELTIIFSANPEGLTTARAYELLTAKVGEVSRRKFNAAVFYMASQRKSLESFGRGKYRFIGK